MLSESSKLSKWLMAIPVILMVTLANVFISFTCAGVILIQLLGAGVNKHLSLGAALLIAVGVHAYIVFNHKIRNFINKQGKTNNE